MNVTCTGCSTIFRVDPAKVPAGGVRARCSVCGGVFAVPDPAGGLPPAPVPDRRATPVAHAAPPVAPRATPPPPPAPAVAPAAAPPQPSPAASPPPPAPAPPVRRAVNPFLSQDPHAKARRLARALVSDIVVYHPEKRRDGLRDGTLKLLFEEEILKSWEEYTEQVGIDLAKSTPFFHDALNEILADGQPIFP